MLAKLKDTQAKEQQSIGQLSDALDESRAALKDRLVAISKDRTPERIAQGLSPTNKSKYTSYTSLQHSYINR